MAKGQKRSNREIKKPKQVKPVSADSAATSSAFRAKPVLSKRGAKKS